MEENPNIGRVLEGKYEIVRAIGSGGMGEVFEAHHRLIRRRLAVKLLHSEYASEHEVVQRFQWEARISAAIGNDHIVEITDMGVTETGELFIVMEYLEGTDLHHVLKTEGRVNAKRACHIMIQVLSALEAAHAKGVVHRDLKPANIFLTSHLSSPDYVKLLDFGISKVRASEGDMSKGLTRTGILLGTPTYMSPEQANGSTDISQATDIYSCGVILYEMLTGVLPFSDIAIASLLVKIMTQAPRDPSTLAPDLHPQLTQAILRAMEKEPGRRFPDAASFRRVLDPFSPQTAFLTGLATTRISQRAADVVKEFAKDSRRSLTDGDPSKRVATTPLSMAVTSTKKKTKSRLPLIIGIPVAVAAAAVLAFLGVSQLRQNKPEPVPTVVPLNTTPEESQGSGPEGDAHPAASPDPPPSSAVPLEALSPDETKETVKQEPQVDADKTDESAQSETEKKEKSERSGKNRTESKSNAPRVEIKVVDDTQDKGEQKKPIEEKKEKKKTSDGREIDEDAPW